MMPGNQPPYQEWYAEQRRLDRSREVDAWVSFPNDPDYNFRALQDFRKNITTSQARDDYHYICSRLRAQLDRNICTILSPKLYRKSLIRTKQLIHDYVEDMVQCIWYIAKWRGRPLNQWSEKSTVLYEVKDRVFGRTSLVLTGGAALNLCHIGVVKTLFEQQLLPQIITGISSGSLIASLVGISTDHELRELIKLKNIDLKAFAERDKGQDQGWWIQRQISAFQRRRIRLLTTGTDISNCLSQRLTFTRPRLRYRCPAQDLHKITSARSPSKRRTRRQAGSSTL